MAPVIHDDPLPSFNFLVIVTGVSDDGSDVQGAFAEASGLEGSLPAIKYRTGAETITERQIPGKVEYPNIVLKRGATGDIRFWNWIVEAINGRVRRTEGAIVLLDENRQEYMRYTFSRAWPTKFTGPTLNANDNQIAMETLEIAHEGLKIDGQIG
jgi:phage tail-like protein